MIRPLLLALLILLAPAAAAAEPAPRTAAEADAFLRRLMTDVSAYSTPHQALVTEAEDLVLFAIEGGNTAVAMADRRASRREVAAWADAWEAQTASKIAAIRAKAEQLPPFPEAAFQRLVDLEPAFRAQVPAYRKVGVETRRLIDLCASYAESVAETVRKAALGDDQALDQLSIRIIHGTRLVIEGENTMLEVSIAATDDSHPQKYVSLAALHGNLAILALYDLAMADMAGEETDRAAVAETMRVEAKAALAAPATSTAPPRRSTAGWRSASRSTPSRRYGPRWPPSATAAPSKHGSPMSFSRPPPALRAARIRWPSSRRTPWNYRSL